MANKIFEYPVLYFSVLPMEEIAQEIRDDITRLDFSGQPVCGETGIDGLKLDFCSGVRVSVPAGKWRVRISDYLSEMVFFDGDVSEHVLISLEKYFIHWKVEIYFEGDLVFSHEFNPKGTRVNFVSGKALGETISFLSYIAEFRREYGAEVSLTSELDLAEIVGALYPEIAFYREKPKDCYAMYIAASCQCMENRCVCMAADDHRILPMEEVGRLCYGINYPVQKNRYTPRRARQIKEPYVCIAVQASGVMKAWHYPGGWDVVTGYLQQLGYRVLCIDADGDTVHKGIVVRKPDAAEDFRGRKPLTERADMLYYADFFIGLGSGLSWLADAVGCPAVIISGFSLPYSEPPTPYRIVNTQVCHGCFNDLRVKWVKDICPYHKGTEREFECSKKISPLMVIEAIERLRRDNGVQEMF